MAQNGIRGFLLFCCTVVSQGVSAVGSDVDDPLGKFWWLTLKTVMFVVAFIDQASYTLQGLAIRIVDKVSIHTERGDRKVDIWM
jgi:hypothetical protein